VPDRELQVLYCDWERTKSVLDWRLQQIQSGHNIDFGNRKIHYLRCYHPLADIIEQIEEHKHNLGIDLIINDSLALASGGNQSESESAIRYYAAVRRLALPTITTAHRAKNQDSKNSSIFGSVYFANLASDVWEVEKTQDDDSLEFTIALTHKFANLSRKHKPIGIKFTFSEVDPTINDSYSVTITRADLSKTADALGESKSSIHSKLYSNKDVFVKMGKEWGVIAKGQGI
jgi:hypothetical protein